MPCHFGCRCHSISRFFFIYLYVSRNDENENRTRCFTYRMHTAVFLTHRKSIKTCANQQENKTLSVTVVNDDRMRSQRDPFYSQLSKCLQNGGKNQTKTKVTRKKRNSAQIFVVSFAVNTMVYTKYTEQCSWRARYSAKAVTILNSLTQNVSKAQLH